MTPFKIRFAPFQRIIVALAFIVSALPSIAVATTYTGKAPVNSQSDADRAAALSVALADVVTRLTGDSAVVTRPDVARAIAASSKRVQQYQYRRTRAEDGSTSLTLVADFDADSVNNLLRQIGLAPAEADDTSVGFAPSEAKIWVNGIRSSEDYARVVRYFSGLDLVKSATPIEIHGDGLLLQVALNSDIKRFTGVVQAGSMLTLADATPADGSDLAFVMTRH